MRRVVVTGLGLLAPLGSGVQANWDRLLNGENAVDTVTSFKVDDLSCQIAASLPISDADDADSRGLYNPDQWVPAKDRRKVEAFIVYAMVAAKQAVEDCGWRPANEAQSDRAGVLIGSGIGGLEGIEKAAIALHDRGARRVSPFFITSSLINLATGQVAIQHGWRGPNHACVTACASGAHAIGDAARMIIGDQADIMIAGGTESAVGRLAMAGFAAMRALSTKFNDRPDKASRPWDQDRDGFVMGEGAGILILEEYEHARRRSAPIYAEVKGYGLSGDAHHITAPARDGSGAFRAMTSALLDASLTPEDIGYINAHGTSTPLGDAAEIAATKRLFGDHAAKLAISSTKSAIGHLLGAAGSVEAIFSIMAIRDGVVPPTRNLDNVSDDCRGVDLVPHTAQERGVIYALSNSFGFGGTNACLIFGPPP